LSIIYDEYNKHRLTVFKEAGEKKLYLAKKMIEWFTLPVDIAVIIG